MNLTTSVTENTDSREAERRASYVAQLRRAADLIEQYELPVSSAATINAPIVCLPDDQADAILTAAAGRVGMPVNRATPSQPCIYVDLGGGGHYHIYYSNAARSAAYDEASKRMGDWSAGLDAPSTQEPELTVVENEVAHICRAGDLSEVRMSTCACGCKVMACAVCKAERVVHSAAYGCRQDEAHAEALAMVAEARHGDDHARCTPEDCEDVHAQWRLATRAAHDEGNHNACDPDDCEFGMAGLADALRPTTDAAEVSDDMADKAAEAEDL